MTYTKWTPEKVKEVAQLKEEGYTYAEISEKMDVSFDAIRMLVQRSKLAHPKSAMDFKKLNRHQLAKLFGLSNNSIYRWVEQELLKTTKRQNQHFIDIADFHEFVIKYRDNPSFSELQKIDLVKLKELMGGLKQWN